MSTADPIQDDRPSGAAAIDPVISRHVAEARAAFDAENYDRAIAACERLLAQRPDCAEALMLLGLTSWKLDEPVHAIGLLKRAHEADPDTGDYADALATILAHLGDSTDSLYYAKFATILAPHPLGDDLLPAKFRDFFTHLAFARPHIYRTRAREALERGALGDAIGLLAKQIELTPRDPETMRLAFEAHLENGTFAQAITAIEAVIEDAATAEDHDRMARGLSAAGFHEAALERHEAATALRPDDAEIEQSKLRTLAAQYGDGDGNGDGDGANEYSAACRAWFSRHAAATPDAPHENPPEPDRRLRIGYAGADLHAGGLAPTLEPVLRAHDTARYEVFVYAHGTRQDMATQNLMRHCTRWTDLNGVDPQTAAEIMRNDGLDIIVDLTGHGRGSHLRTLACAPAPVRLSWLGVRPATPGIYDAQVVGTQPGMLVCEHPIARPGMPHAPKLRATPDVPLTFGIVAPVGAIGAQTIEAARVALDAVADARLLIANTGHYDDETMARIHHAVDEAGLRERTIVAELDDPAAPSSGFFEHIDIALDTWPHSRFREPATALSFGIPVLTPRGSRISGFVTSLNFDSWVYETMDDLRAAAARLAGIRSQGTSLADELQAQLAASLLHNPAAFTRDLEAVYRKHWNTWCAGRNG